MFDLTIASFRESDDGFNFYSGRLLLGKHAEFLACSAARWKPQQYRRQWLAAAKRLLSRSEATSAFVTSVGRGRRTNRIEWWPARRKGSEVVFRNQLLFIGRQRLRLSPECAHKYVSLLAFKPTGGQKPSEWRVNIKDIQRFVGRRNVA